MQYHFYIGQEIICMNELFVGTEGEIDFPHPTKGESLRVDGIYGEFLYFDCYAYNPDDNCKSIWHKGCFQPIDTYETNQAIKTLLKESFKK